MKSQKDARVLIIESDDALRVMLFTILRHQPLNVDTASTADAAMERVLSCDYAVIIIDMDIPNDESVSFLRSFRDERPQATSFIIAVRDPATERSIDAQLVNAVLNKPLEIDTLSEVVRECANVIPRPPDPLPCPPAESEVRDRFDRSGSTLSN
jgi:DNA-binding response OmpR family regulator